MGEVLFIISKVNLCIHQILMAAPKQQWEVLGEQFIAQYYQYFDSNAKEQMIAMYHVSFIYYVLALYMLCGRPA